MAGVVRAGIKLNNGVSPVLKTMVTSVRGVIKAFDQMDQGVAKGVDISALRIADKQLQEMEAHLQGFDKTGSGGGVGGLRTAFGKLGGVITVANQGLQLFQATAGRALQAVKSAVGAVLSMGNERAGAIEGAEATLNGLHHSAEEIASIMENAKQSVLGTAFGLGDAGKVAASAVAAGIAPGKNLERYLTLVGDAASIAKVDMSDMGAIFNKVAAGEKMTAQELNQLTDKGIPALSLLADSMGTSTGAIREMVSEGKIGIAELQDAIELGMGGAAKSVRTFEAGVANTKAALGRLGASFLKPFRGIGKDILADIILAIDKLTAITEPAFERIANRIGVVADFLSDELLPHLERIGPIIENSLNRGIDIFEQIAPVMEPVIDMTLDMIEQFQYLTSELANNQAAFEQLNVAIIIITGGSLLTLLEIILAINTACYGAATAVWAVVWAIQSLQEMFSRTAAIGAELIGDFDAMSRWLEVANNQAADASGSFEEMKKSALATGDAAKLMGNMAVGAIGDIANAMNGVNGLRSTLYLDILRREFGAGAQGSANNTGQAVTNVHPNVYSGTNKGVADTNITGAAKQTAKNTKQTADNTAKSKEDLKYLRDVATRKAVNRFTTASLNLTYTANNQVNSDRDIDGMSQDFFGRLVEGVNAIAEA